MLVAFIQDAVTINHFTIYTSVALVLMLYLISENEPLLVNMISVGFAAGLLFKWKMLGLIYSLAFLSVVICIILMWKYFLDLCNKKLLSVDVQQKKINDDIHILKDKYNARVESLTHLERQVTGLLNLFEVARDFNECLSYGELMLTLSKKVRSEIPYQELVLSILDSKNSGSPEIVRVFSSSANHDKAGEERPISEFDQFCFEQVRGQRKIIQLSSLDAGLPEELRKFSILFPLWIFAIQSKENTIAVLAVQGTHGDDFPKYELLASQLALQVKKIGLYETVKELSIVDGLTKVFVRRHFLERFEEELKRAIKRRNSLSVLLLDIDHFKSYNDTFGHLVGDSTLREVASVIREHVRKVDLVARYGGEEFVIVMPEITSPFNLETAERIRSAIAHKKFRIYDEETKATVSIGVASFPVDLDQPQVAEFRDSLMLELVQKADKALYKAKEDGRNRVVSYHMIKK